MKASITVISEPGLGQRFEIPTGDLVIGREEDCQLVVDNVSVSRRHCMLIRTASTLSVRDLGSKSGTWVNSTPIRDSQPCLSHGDTIQVGTFVVRIDLDDA